MPLLLFLCLLAHLLPPASASPELIKGVGRMSLCAGKGEVSSPWMKRELVTPTQTVATVAIKMAAFQPVFHGNVARVLGCVRPVLSTAVCSGGEWGSEEGSVAGVVPDDFSYSFLLSSAFRTRTVNKQT